MNKVVKLFPGDYNGRGDGGSGPEDPMLEKRVETLEADTKEMKASLSRMEVTLARIDGTLSQMPKAMDFASLRAEVSDIKSNVSRLPTFWMFAAGLISTWMAGAAIVLALIKFSN
jgi:hypothetical protein